MGASLAGIYAARFPERALSVAFLRPPSITCPKVSEVEKLASEGINISVPKTLEQFHQKIDFLFRVKPRVLQDQLDDIGRDEIAQYDAHIAVYDIVKKDDLLLDQYLDEIFCPTLIVWGERRPFQGRLRRPPRREESRSGGTAHSAQRRARALPGIS